MNAGIHVGGETGLTTLMNNGDWKQMVLLYLLNDTRGSALPFLWTRLRNKLHVYWLPDRSSSTLLTGPQEGRRDH